MIFKVLSQTKDDNNLVLFDGAKNVLFTKGDNKLYMYRRDNPLYYVKTEDGIYISSLEEGLETIGGKDCKIVEVTENVLYTLEEGKIVNKRKIKHKHVKSEVSINNEWRSYGFRKMYKK